MPDLHPSDPCLNASAPYVPSTATRQANLPAQDNFVALVPHISAACTLAYLHAGRMDPLRALILYSPGPGLVELPEADQADDVLGAGSGRWREESKFPVYTVGRAEGRELMEYLGRYSGNMTQVYRGHNLTELYDLRSSPRLYTMISTRDTATFPWIGTILLATLGIIAGLFVFAVVIRHLVHRRMRASLRRRIVAGEVDLEAIGVKRTLVPSRVLKAMPCFVYVADEETNASFQGLKHPALRGVTTEHSTSEPSEASTTTIAETGTAPSVPAKPAPTLPSRTYPPSSASCPICLDEYTSQLTPVRELPCGHVYHPACIDKYLRTRSSLCPLCKTSVLPAGYCPARITNCMVRRERLVRLRARGGRSPHRNVLGRAWSLWWWSDLYAMRVPGRGGRGRRAGGRAGRSESEPGSSATGDVEMGGSTAVSATTGLPAGAEAEERRGQAFSWRRKIHFPFLTARR